MVRTASIYSSASSFIRQNTLTRGLRAGFFGLAEGAPEKTGKPRVGHSWTRFGGANTGPLSFMDNWMSSLDESGCAPGVVFAMAGPPNPNGVTVGSGGGYGGFYCFALVP